METLGVSIPEAGKMIAGREQPLSPDTIYRMVARGELEARKIGHRTIITVASIRALVEGAERLGQAA